MASISLGNQDFASELSGVNSELYQCGDALMRGIISGVISLMVAVGVLVTLINSGEELEWAVIPLLGSDLFILCSLVRGRGKWLRVVSRELVLDIIFDTTGFMIVKFFFICEFSGIFRLYAVPLLLSCGLVISYKGVVAAKAEAVYNVLRYLNKFIRAGVVLMVCLKLDNSITWEWSSVLYSLITLSLVATIFCLGCFSYFIVYTILRKFIVYEQKLKLAGFFLLTCISMNTTYFLAVLLKGKSGELLTPLSFYILAFWLSTVYLLFIRKHVLSFLATYTTHMNHTNSLEVGQVTAIRLRRRSKNLFKLQESDERVEIIVPDPEPISSWSNSDGKCSICFDNPPTSVFMDCGHGGLCYPCALTLYKRTRKCFLCRAKISRIYEISENSSKFYNVDRETKFRF